MLVFVDTGGWIALLKSDDEHHVTARAYYEEALRSGARFLTTNYVIDETATRLRYDASLSAALVFRKAVLQGVARRTLKVRWVDPQVENDAWDLLAKRARVELSLTDATSAVIAGRARVSHVFGFDADFRALGFDVRPAQ